MPLPTRATGEVPRIEVEWIAPLATWQWAQLKNQTCSICRISLNEAALLAPNTSYEDQEDASHFTDVIIGECGHSFHRACIERWLKVRPVCPQCVQPWAQQAVKSFHSSTME